jgi:hypothetical protein
MERSSTSIKITLFLFIVLQSSCIEKTYKYDTRFNDVRDSIGLPKLEEDWDLYKDGTDFRNRSYLIFINPSVNKNWDKNSPIHYSKTIEYTSDTIVYEDDIYYNGKTFKTAEGDLSISLAIKYYFINDTIDNEKGGWSYTLFSNPLNYFQGDKLTKGQADSLLINWKLKK